MSPEILIVGAGPAGLMAAFRLASLRAQKKNIPIKIRLIERRSAIGRKLLIAGSSGLNITHEHASAAEFSAVYSDPDKILPALLAFTPRQWCEWIQGELGIDTFMGTSMRFFIEDKKAAQMLKRWEERLRELGVEICTQTTWSASPVNADAQPAFTVLALGGGSWEELPLTVETELRKAWGIETTQFTAANCGYQVAWKNEFLNEAEGRPLKSITLRTAQGVLPGELMITRYGLEGTPIYTLGEVGPAWIDLKPAWSEAEIVQKLRQVSENLNLNRRVKKKLGLSDVALALWFHHSSVSAAGTGSGAGVSAPAESFTKTLEQAAHELKNFRIELLAPQPLREAISARGGVKWSELTPEFELLKRPGVFCAGEMIDWHAPTGGYLIQACVSSGWYVAEQIAARLRV